MHLDILSWLCQPCCLTPQGHHALKSHLTLPEGLGTGGEEASGGNPATDSTWCPCFSLSFYGVLVGYLGMLVFLSLSPCSKTLPFFCLPDDPLGEWEERH